MTTLPEMPLVSIVTPTLNQAQFIEATLRSVMDQTYPAVEHIVIDGGSTDGTLDVLRAYQSRYRMRWSSGRDKGMYDAINKGLRQAEGEILAYLNSDDVYLPWTIEEVVSGFRQRPNARVLFGDALLVNPERAEAALGFFPGHYSGYLLRVGYVCQPTVFWRRAAYEAAGGFDSELSLLGDHDYWLRVGGQFPLVKVDELLALERHHAARKVVAKADALPRELAVVRKRYEARSPLGARLAAGYWRFRTWAWRRAIWFRFVAAWLRPENRSGSWARLMAVARPRLSWTRVVALQAPLVGRRFANGAVEWPTGWIEGLLGVGRPPGPVDVQAGAGVAGK